MVFQSGDVVYRAQRPHIFIWKGNDIASLDGEERRITEIGLICGSGENLNDP